ncbi:hypothetical protein SARC_06449 [Sphaeroforma arctica JP610]|uniref:Uncharacterized protein n=1 Tax=Sphaeroforma arctica JP610 TaxID=667725 RepID=A0A0L0FXE4_9EUKA|nr:hypothetical protein SARC_06449 [Sphaeroforma arctica JP610]KNC81221.1 hypothetical protein SARC_06449 [Sphaeroforma arctica JP610]|eukprot:XP_014155123.1 hypothetical protein SARC_06449 [Sphaeroforma arctica JP610]
MSVEQVEEEVNTILELMGSDHDTGDMAADMYSSYGSIPQDIPYLLKAVVVKASNIGNILGTRNARQRKRKEKHIPTTTMKRIDLVATSIRRAAYLIGSHEVAIRDGSTNFPELDLTDSVIQTMRSKQGWARRRPHGSQYGTTFITKYPSDIRTYFELGEQDSARKMQPGAMLDQLRTDYPVCYSLPGENETRVLVSTLMADKKATQRTEG